MSSPPNIIGPVVRELRLAKGWTQAMLAARCARLGWDMSENTVTKIEKQFRCVSDREIVCLAGALGVRLEEVFPADARQLRRPDGAAGC